jgi:hypothetical protein
MKHQLKNETPTQAEFDKQENVRNSKSQTKTETANPVQRLARRTEPPFLVTSLDQLLPDYLFTSSFLHLFSSLCVEAPTDDVG